MESEIRKSRETGFEIRTLQSPFPHASCPGDVYYHDLHRRNSDLELCQPSARDPELCGWGDVAVINLQPACADSDSPEYQRGRRAEDLPEETGGSGARQCFYYLH